MTVKSTNGKARKRTSRRHWGQHTFMQTKSSDIGKYGYCSECFADMQIFYDDGLWRHYSSHHIANDMGLWGK